MARKRSTEPKKPTVWVVERLAWHFWYDDDDDKYSTPQPYCNDNSSGEEQGGVPVAAFADRAKAEALCKELERQGRSEVCLFQFLHSDPEAMSSKGETAFVEAIQKIGLTPPVAREGKFGVSWYHWWQEVEPGLTAEQREAVWELADQVKFYRVVECEVED